MESRGTKRPPALTSTASAIDAPAQPASKKTAIKKAKVSPKPVATKPKPAAARAAKPAAAKAAKPPAKTAKPAAKTAKRAARTAKPAAKEAKPAAKEAKPAAKSAKPAAKAAKPALKTAKPVKKPAAKPAPKIAAKSSKSGPLEVGTAAPDFSVKDQDGTEVALGSFKGQKNVVVFFYPKDNTPGCTKEACKFRDLKDEYDELDCTVLGVSADHAVSHGKFIAKYGLTFSLLADTNRSLIKSYGASKAADKIQRSTVLIDKEGNVAAVWNPVSGAEQHPVQVLAKLKEIAAA